jgi:hypothetical protein
VEQFGTLLSQVSPTLQGLQQQGAAVQQQLDILLSQPNPDPASVGKLVMQLHAIQLQINHVIDGFHNAFAGLLSQDQIQKLRGVTAAAQLQRLVRAFVALYLVPPPPTTACQK